MPTPTVTDTVLRRDEAGDVFAETAPSRGQTRVTAYHGDTVETADLAAIDAPDPLTPDELRAHIAACRAILAHLEDPNPAVPTPAAPAPALVSVTAHALTPSEASALAGLFAGGAPPDDIAALHSLRRRGLLAGSVPTVLGREVAGFLGELAAVKGAVA